jgi:hypothetical protein
MYGLQDWPGEIADGHRCRQSTQVELLMQSKTGVVIKVQKPGNYSKALAVTLRAQGETMLVADYSLTMTHSKSINGVRTVVGDAAWKLLRDRRLALNGYHLMWTTAPSDDAELDLDGTAARVAVTKEYGLRLRLDCVNEQLCIADADAIETTMHIGSSGDPGMVESEVSFIVQVEALASCEKSVAWVDIHGIDIPESSSFRVHLAAVDVDDLPVNFTRVDFLVLFDNASVPLQWNPGSNVYVSEVPTQATRAPGKYQLLVLVRSAWTESGSQVTTCELLRRTISVRAGLNSTWVLVGAGCLSVIVLGGLFFVINRYRHKLRAVLLMLFTEVAELVGTFLFELADLISDAITCFRVLNGSITSPAPCGAERTPPLGEGYKVAYATFMFFGSLGAVVSIAYRIRNARLVAAHVKDLVSQRALDAGSTESKTSMQKYQWERSQTYRSITISSLTLMSLAIEGAAVPPCVSCAAPAVLSECRRLIVEFCIFVRRCCCRCAHVGSELLFDLRRPEHR